MIITDLSILQEWIGRRGFNNPFTVTFTLSAAAFNISTYTFTLNIRRFGATTNLLQLTQGSGITNGGASGILSIQLTAAQSTTIGDGSYFYELVYTVGGLPYGLIHGTFNNLSGINVENENNSISAPINLAGTDVNLAITLASGTDTRTISTTSTATLTPNVSLYDLFVISAQAEALVIANPTGTAVLGNGFMIDIDDNGSARAITYGNLYTSTFVTLPTTTIAGKRMKMVFQYNGTNWELLNVINEL
jgi:hypothetical protein